MSKATLHSQAQLLVVAAAKAGTRVTASQRQEIDRWTKRAERTQSAVPAPTAPASRNKKDLTLPKSRGDADTRAI